MRRVHARGLLCVGHAILGLPGDGREGARRTAEALARSGVAGVKVHHLMVLRKTQMEKAWRESDPCKRTWSKRSDTPNQEIGR